MIWAPCDAECQDKDQYACRADERAFELVDEFSDDEGVFYEARCGNCGRCQFFSVTEWQEAGKAMDRRAYRRRANLTRYPRIEPHTGELVKSRDHEHEVVKAAGFHVAEHGINDAYHDELSEKLRSNRVAMEDRRKAIRKKREHLIREGVIKPPKRGPKNKVSFTR